MKTPSAKKTLNLEVTGREGSPHPLLPYVEEPTRHLRQSILKSARVLWMARVDYGNRSGLGVHKQAGHYQIIYFCTGKGVFTLEGKEYAITPETLFLMRPNQRRGFRNFTRKNLITLDVKFQINNPLLHSAMKKAPQIHRCQDSEIRNWLEAIRLESLRKKPYWEDSGGLYLLHIIFKLLREQKTSGSPFLEKSRGLPAAGCDPLTQRVRELIEADFSRGLSMTSMAAALKFGYNHIYTKFKADVGMSPMRYLSFFRIEKAKEMIEYSGLELKEVAQRTGFEDVQHFTRVFKQRTGVPPAAWRKKQVEKIGAGVFFSTDAPRKARGTGGL